MTRRISRLSSALAIGAALSMVATPAFADGWGGRRHYRHHDRVDAGDIFAGVLVIGAIAAIAGAASKAQKERRDRDDYRSGDKRASNGDYPGAPSRDDRPAYGGARGDASGDYGNRSQGWRDSAGLDGAVDTCVAEVERADREVDTVDTVSRESGGWRVSGQVSGGREFACAVDADGRVRSVTVDGQAAFAGSDR